MSRQLILVKCVLHVIKERHQVDLSFWNFIFAISVLLFVYFEAHSLQSFYSFRIVNIAKTVDRELLLTLRYFLSMLGTLGFSYFFHLFVNFRELVKKLLYIFHFKRVESACHCCNCFTISELS